MKAVRDGAGKELKDARFLDGLRAETADGVEIDCMSVVVVELGEASAPFEWEVSCLGINFPVYEKLFPHHVNAYKDQFKV